MNGAMMRVCHEPVILSKLILWLWGEKNSVKLRSHLSLKKQSSNLVTSLGQESGAAWTKPKLYNYRQFLGLSHFNTWTLFSPFYLGGLRTTDFTGSKERLYTTELRLFLQKRFGFTQEYLYCFTHGSVCC